jgi:hypothetical protein
VEIADDLTTARHLLETAPDGHGAQPFRAAAHVASTAARRAARGEIEILSDEGQFVVELITGIAATFRDAPNQRDEEQYFDLGADRAAANALPALLRAGSRKRELVFTDRVIVTLVVLRFQLPHAALAVFYGVDRSTITRAVGEVRPLLAARGFAVPDSELRLRSLADVFAYAAAQGVTLRIDGTEVRVRRPRACRPGRRAFISGKMRQNTMKATVITDADGRTAVDRGVPSWAPT